MKMIGVGFGRSGTMSLKAALEELTGEPSFHMIELITNPDRDRYLPYWSKIADREPVDWHEVFEGWGSTVDWPGAARWEEMVEAFPDVPVLLNYRDFDGFYKSCQNTIVAVRNAAQAGELKQDANREPPSPELWRVIGKLIYEDDFQGRFEDKEWMRQMYHDRIETIKTTVPAERLVVWELGADGWEPLADALGVEAPDKPFPHLHDTNEFRVEFGLDPLPA